MFAPHCPSCRRRVLLSTDHLVRLSWQDGERTAILRCFCGALVDWDQRPPPVTPRQRGSGAPAEADSEDRRFVGAVADRLSVRGIDLERGMVDVAIRHAEDDKLGDRVQFTVAELAIDWGAPTS